MKDQKKSNKMNENKDTTVAQIFELAHNPIPGTVRADLGQSTDSIAPIDSTDIKVEGKILTISTDPQADFKRELRIRARTTRMLPMAYKIDETVVKAWRGYVLEKCGSQLGAGPLLEEILREYLPKHGFEIGKEAESKA